MSTPPVVLLIKAYRFGEKCAVVDTAAAVGDPQAITLSSFLQSQLSSKISFNDDQIVQIKSGTTDIKNLLSFPVSTVLPILKIGDGTNTIILKIDSPRRGNANEANNTNSNKESTTVIDGPDYLIEESQMDFFKLETSRSYDDVIHFQEAQLITKSNRASFLLQYEDEPTYDQQGMAVIAEKMPNPLS